MVKSAEDEIDILNDALGNIKAEIEEIEEAKIAESSEDEGGIENRNPIWDDLEELRSTLSHLPIEAVKKYIVDNMADDVEGLQQSFKADFGELPQTSPLRLEVLQTLAELGILIY